MSDGALTLTPSYGGAPANVVQLILHEYSMEYINSAPQKPHITVLKRIGPIGDRWVHLPASVRLRDGRVLLVKPSKVALVVGEKVVGSVVLVERVAVELVDGLAVRHMPDHHVFGVGQAVPD